MSDPQPNAPRPVPAPNSETQFFWDAAKRGELAILRCEDCRTFIHPPKHRCRGCLSENLAPYVVSGRGRVYTLTRTHYVYHPAFREQAPYVVALVELEEDPSVRLVSNIVECALEEAAIGMAVEVVFERVTDDITLPQFRPRLPRGEEA